MRTLQHGNVRKGTAFSGASSGRRTTSTAARHQGEGWLSTPKARKFPDEEMAVDHLSVDVIVPHGWEACVVRLGPTWAELQRREEERVAREKAAAARRRREGTGERHASCDNCHTTRLLSRHNDGRWLCSGCWSQPARHDASDVALEFMAGREENR